MVSSWRSPSGGTQQQIYQGSAYGNEPIEGTIQNGTFNSQAAPGSSLSPFQEAGTYVLEYIVVQDNAGNYAFYSNSDLRSTGLNVDAASITVTTTQPQDITPPKITAISVSNPSIAVGSTAVSFATAGVKISVSDALSGINYLAAYWELSSGGPSQFVVEGPAYGMEPSEGTIQSGTFISSQGSSGSYLSPFQEAGTYFVAP